MCVFSANLNTWKDARLLSFCTKLISRLLSAPLMLCVLQNQDVKKSAAVSGYISSTSLLSSSDLMNSSCPLCICQRSIAQLSQRKLLINSLTLHTLGQVWHYETHTQTHTQNTSGGNPTCQFSACSINCLCRLYSTKNSAGCHSASNQIHANHEQEINTKSLSPTQFLQTQDAPLGKHQQQNASSKESLAAERRLTQALRKKVAPTLQK